MTGLVDHLFLEHPRSAGQGYLEHLRFAWRVAATMAWGAVAAFLHGMLPVVLQTTAGDRIRALHALLHARSSTNEDVSQPH
jgi:Family of unknown function (DUF6356)